MRNFVPGRYRGVSVAKVDCPLTDASLREHFLGREAYRHTEFVVARRGEEAALLRLTKAGHDALFSPVVDVEVLAGSGETAVVSAPEADPGIPSHLARAAAELAPGARCVVVYGRYQHISFILDPAPVPVRVVEVEPPRPAKLVDQIRRVLDVAEDLPPVDLRTEVFDLVDLAARRPARRYLFPCRGSAAAPEGAEVAYLDERPSRADWVLVGCRRSREIHRWFYGSEPPTVEMCPRELAGSAVVATLTKCCMLEQGLEQEGSLTVVPWGATLDEVWDGLRALLRIAGPAWAPA